MGIAVFPLRRSSVRAICTLGVASLLLAACVAAPDDSAHLGAGDRLDQRSEQGLVNATVELETRALTRGPNDFVITLSAAQGTAAPVLTSVEAVMAAHGHHASAPSIVLDAGAFRVEHLDLFMSGVWQVTLGVELEARSDSVDFALDVP